MTAGKKSKPKATQSTVQTPRWRTILLALTLTPVIAGALLVAAWALDISLLGALENQMFIGLLFILLGFTLANLAQGKWMLFAGWLLLTVADALLIVLTPILTVQVIALGLAAVGATLLLIEFSRQYRRQTGA